MAQKRKAREEKLEEREAAAAIMGFNYRIFQRVLHSKEEKETKLRALAAVITKRTKRNLYGPVNGELFINDFIEKNIVDIAKCW